jgi:hypothetical protein
MVGVPDHGLVQIANLHVDAAFRIGERPKITGVAIAADSYRRTVGY